MKKEFKLLKESKEIKSTYIDDVDLWDSISDSQLLEVYRYINNSNDYLFHTRKTNFTAVENEIEIIAEDKSKDRSFNYIKDINSKIKDVINDTGLTYRLCFLLEKKGLKKKALRGIAWCFGSWIITYIIASLYIAAAPIILIPIFLFIKILLGSLTKSRSLDKKIRLAVDFKNKFNTKNRLSIENINLAICKEDYSFYKKGLIIVASIIGIALILGVISVIVLGNHNSSILNKLFSGAILIFSIIAAGIMIPDLNNKFRKFKLADANIKMFMSRNNKR